MNNEIINKIDKEIELTIDRSLDFSSPGACIFISGLERAKEIIKEASDLLAEYEATGLSPKNIILRENDIKFLQRQNKEYREVILSLQKQLMEENHERD